MFTPEMYQLLDFGHGRRLEAFGPWRLDRPCPAAERFAPAHAGAWAEAHARFERTGESQGRWIAREALPPRWTISHGPMRLELKPTDFGHLGVFPEQAANWEWLAAELARCPQPARVLNLFAYTGGSTLAAAAAGAEVVHVDAARNVVAWARRNAEHSGLGEAAIRWIVEDAQKFVRRELRRGNRYDAVILDPPSYGHGAQGEVWRLSKHLARLVQWCGQLTAGRRRFILLTCHTPDFGPQRLKRLVAQSLGDTGRGTLDAAPMAITAADGRELPSGVVVRWSVR